MVLNFNEFQPGHHSHQLLENIYVKITNVLSAAYLNIFFFFFFLLLSICSKNGGGQDHDGHINYHGDSSLILIQRELVKG